MFIASQLPGGTLSLSVEVVDDGALDGLVGSLKLKLVGGGQTHLRTENNAPYALFGDNNGNLTGGAPLGPGAYQFEVQAFSGRNGGGILRDTFIYDFEVQSTASESLL